MRELAGRTAIITGASAGIGEEVARRLAAEKVNLVLAARSADKLDRLAAELSATGVRAVSIPTDVADPNALEDLVANAHEEFRRIDILVNNAGIEAFRQFHDLELEEILSTIEVNLTAAIVLTRLVVPHMIERGEGHIVNMSSTAGKFGPCFGGVYGASKAGLIAFTEALRGEYRGTGISASVICPGFTNSGGIYEEMKKRMGRGTPFQMGGTNSKTVAGAVLTAIRKDTPEKMLNSPPMRPIAIIKAFSPSLGEWIVRQASYRFLRKVAATNSSIDAESKAVEMPEIQPTSNDA